MERGGEAEPLVPCYDGPARIALDRGAVAEAEKGEFPMTTNGRTAPIALGEPAPDFTLTAAHVDGTVSLAEYRGHSALLLALFRGLY